MQNSSLLETMVTPSEGTRRLRQPGGTAPPRLRLRARHLVQEQCQAVDLDEEQSLADSVALCWDDLRRSRLNSKACSRICRPRGGQARMMSGQPTPNGNNIRNSTSDISYTAASAPQRPYTPIRHWSVRIVTGPDESFVRNAPGAGPGAVTGATAGAFAAAAPLAVLLAARASVASSWPLRLAVGVTPGLGAPTARTFRELHDLIDLKHPCFQAANAIVAARQSCCLGCLGQIQRPCFKGASDAFSRHLAGEQCLRAGALLECKMQAWQKAFLAHRHDNWRYGRRCLRGCFACDTEPSTHGCCPCSIHDMLANTPATSVRRSGSMPGAESVDKGLLICLMWNRIAAHTVAQQWCQRHSNLIRNLE